MYEHSGEESAGGQALGNGAINLHRCGVLYIPKIEREENVRWASER